MYRFKVERKMDCTSCVHNCPRLLFPRSKGEQKMSLSGLVALCSLQQVKEGAWWCRWSFVVRKPSGLQEEAGCYQGSADSHKPFK